MNLSEKMAGWIKKQVEKAGKKGIVVGLSGGIDSAVCACLSKKAVGDDMLALVLPCENRPEDTEHALQIAEKFHIKTKKIDLAGIFRNMVRACPEGNKLAKANLKPRLRMAMLYYFANTLDYLVAGTGNKSELTVGYFTKYGDGGVDILPLGGLLKTEVKKLAEALDIPVEIINRVPSAGLWEGQTDEGEMGITYEELDRVIVAIERDKTDDIEKNVLEKVKKMMAASEHKRCEIPIFREESAGI